MRREDHFCCMSMSSGVIGFVLPRRGHVGKIRCGRRKRSSVRFENGAKDCKCWTCARHAVQVGRVRLCGGCAAERRVA